MPLDVPGSRLTEEEKQAALVNEKWDRNDLLAIYRGVAPEPEDVRQARLENQRNVQGKTLAELGPFRIVWDLCRENFYRSYDGAIPAQFDLAYPDLVVRWVSLADLRPVLHEQSRRDDAELWAEAFATKNAGVLAHWIAGRQVTPPHIVKRDGKVYVAGGNHRLFIAMLKGETHVPVLVSAAEEAAVGSAVRLSLDKPGLSQS